MKSYKCKTLCEFSLTIVIFLASIASAEILYQDDFTDSWTSNLTAAGQVSSDSQYTAREWGSVPSYGRFASNTESQYLRLGCYSTTSTYREPFGITVNSLSLRFSDLGEGEYYRITMNIRFLGGGRAYQTVGITNNLNLSESDANSRDILFGRESGYSRPQYFIKNSSEELIERGATNSAPANTFSEYVIEFDTTVARFYFDGTLMGTVAHGLTDADFADGMYLAIQTRGDKTNQLTHYGDFTSFVVEQVPEPMTMFLLAGGLSAVLIKKIDNSARLLGIMK